MYICAVLISLLILLIYLYFFREKENLKSAVTLSNRMQLYHDDLPYDLSSKNIVFSFILILNNKFNYVDVLQFAMFVFYIYQRKNTNTRFILLSFGYSANAGNFNKNNCALNVLVSYATALPAYSSAAAVSCSQYLIDMNEDYGAQLILSNSLNFSLIQNNILYLKLLSHVSDYGAALAGMQYKILLLGATNSQYNQLSKQLTFYNIQSFHSDLISLISDGQITTYYKSITREARGARTFAVDGDYSFMSEDAIIATDKNICAYCQILADITTVDSVITGQGGYTFRNIKCNLLFGIDAANLFSQLFKLYSHPEVSHATGNNLTPLYIIDIRKKI